MKRSGNRKVRHQKQTGAILGMVLVVMAAISVLGIGLLSLGSADAIEAAKSETKSQAFWNAEAGLEEAKALAWKIRNTTNPDELFPSGGLRTWSGTTRRGTYTVTITQPYFTPPGYRVESKGTSPSGRNAGVSVELLQTAALTMGVFGDEELGIQPNVELFSYHSSEVTGDPVASDSTGEVIIGSNESVDLSPGLSLDGSILLGTGDDDLPADCNGCGLLSVTQTEPVNPDPLGIIGGPLEADFNAARLANNNAAVPEISGTSLTVPNSGLVALPPGDYYLTDVLVRGDLEVEGTDGVVTIYLDGPFDSKPGSMINNNGTPPRFRIFSNSTEQIIIQPDGDLSALVYAPYSLDVRIKPKGNVYGVIWGQNVELFPGGTVFVDLDLLEYDAFTIYQLGLERWQEFSGN